jgi:hypothetical protein
MNKFWLCFLLPVSAQAQLTGSAMWDSVKAAAEPQLTAAFETVYQSPERLSLSDYGWEDGLQVSPDGLHLYTLYAPADLLSWFTYINTNPDLPLCESFGNMEFMRSYANDYGMDMATNFFGCDSAINIDILYANRSHTDEAFDNWVLSDIARPGQIEGGSFPLFNEANPAWLDHFLFTGPGDIWMISNTTANPSGIESATALPYPINSLAGEFIADNPVLCRINSSDTLLIVYEKYIAGFPRDFMYAFSYDDGSTWEEPVKMTTVTSDAGHIEHPQLVTDPEGTWLYYSYNYDIVRSKQSIPGDWDSWLEMEVILTKNNTIALGEPSVTHEGDIFFLAAYESGDPGDQFDIDPWVIKKTIPNQVQEMPGSPLVLYPNPTADICHVQWNYNGIKIYVILYDMYGKVMFTDQKQGSMFDLSLHNYLSGIYFVVFTDENGHSSQASIVVE